MLYCHEPKLLLFLIISIKTIFIETIKSDDYDHKLDIVSPNIYTLYWNYTSLNITAEIRVKTLGWVSFGITKNGKLDGSDLFVAWVKIFDLFLT